MTILEICALIIARQHLARVAATPATLTVAAAAADLRDNYLPTARAINDKMALLEKTAAQVATDEAAAAVLVADSIFYSNDVSAKIAAGANKADAITTAHTFDADATRKARWTLATVRALFGA